MRKPIATLAAVLCASFSSAAFAGQIGVIEQIEQAAYGVAPDSPRAEMHKGDALVHQELLETAAQGGLQARLTDGSRLTLGGASRAELVAYGYRTDGSRGDAIISLAAGSMRYVTGAMPKGHTIIYTPAASMVLTGTNVMVSVDARGTTHLTVAEGSVTVRSKTSGEDTVFQAGQSVDITRDSFTQSTAQATGDPLVDHGFTM
jgi:ferric-dicitrate binding protein FerR (iron transport regulator)